ncbi:MAG: tetratricopeptide repeat protein [Lachnospiraceae bacterium]|nr:tetratricopeptide repeat protein [Lachnospiraceae bacterium]
MKCYNCGCELTNNDFCTNCNADVRDYRRIVRLSNQYYNDGLVKAKVRDLSGAVLSLRACLKLNRMNVNARNLLGLVYFEMGEAVAALSEWVVSKNIKPEKNIADDFMEQVQSNPGRLSTINQSIKKYNQALLYAKQGSLDLSVIQLKKVLQMNPNLVVAYELLGLLYLQSEEYNRARRILLQAAKIDCSNTRILYYLREAEKGIRARTPENAKISSKTKKGEGSGAKNVTASDSFTYMSGNETIIQPINSVEKKGASGIISLIVGVAIGCALMFFLVLPARIRAASSDMNDQLKAVSDELTVKNADLEEQNKRIEALQSENDMVKSQIDELTGSSGMEERYDHLSDAALNYMQNPEDVLGTEAMLESIFGDTVSANSAIDFIGVSANAITLDPDIYSESFRNLYDYVKGGVASKAASTYIKQGRENLSNDEYQEAITNLLRATEIDPSSDEAWYYLAESYKESGDSVHATQIYSKIVDEMPDSEYADRSKKSLTNGAATDNEEPAAAPAVEEAAGIDQDALAQALAAQALQQAVAAGAATTNNGVTEGAQ